MKIVSRKTAMERIGVPYFIKGSYPLWFEDKRTNGHYVYAPVCFRTVRSMIRKKLKRNRAL